MFLLLPVGHAQNIRKIPWVTAGIAAACLLVQLQHTLFAPSARELMSVAAPLYALKELEAGRPVPPELAGLKLPDEPEARAERKAQLEAQLRALRSKDLSWRLGHYYDAGLSPTMLTSAFAHGGWMHLLGNLLFLYLCGCNLEDRWGRGAFLGFYLAGALVSSAVPTMIHHGEHVLSLGASGAIAACMGGFLVFYGATQITLFYLVWLGLRPRWGTFEAAAYWAGGLWFAVQLLNFWFEAHGSSDGVSYSAHVSGFAFGAATALVLKVLGYDRALQKAADGPGDWEEDPEVTGALELLHAGREAEAIAAFKAVRRRLPRNATVESELYALGLKLGDREAVELTASPRLLELIRSGQSDAALEQLAGLEAVMRDPPLSDRALAQLARVGLAARQSELGVRLTNRLIKQAPASPLIPGALVEVARAQLRESRPELARRTLEHVMARYPHDPFALEAQRMLQAAAASELAR